MWAAAPAAADAQLPSDRREGVTVRAALEKKGHAVCAEKEFLPSSQKTGEKGGLKIR